MKIYQVTYMNAEGNYINSFFTSKIEANKAQMGLAKSHNKQRKVKYDDIFEQQFEEIQCLFDMITFDCDISKNGILDMLNNRFGEN